MHGSAFQFGSSSAFCCTVYGAMIFGYGVYELATGQLANVVLANLHAPVWWGGFLFRPRDLLHRQVSPGRDSQ